MSKRNIADKKVAGTVRRAKKGRALRKVPTAGLVIGNTEIRRHSYLAEHGLPYSDSVGSAPLHPPLSIEERDSGRQSYRTKWAGSGFVGSI